jgi:hypothetical protein
MLLPRLNRSIGEAKMALDERSRRALYLRLEEALGADEADTLMEHLPPVGWADVATRRDLDMLRIELRAEIAQMAAQMTRGFAAQTRTTVLASIGSAIGVATLVLAAVRL